MNLHSSLCVIYKKAVLFVEKRTARRELVRLHEPACWQPFSRMVLRATSHGETTLRRSWTPQRVVLFLSSALKFKARAVVGDAEPDTWGGGVTADVRPLISKSSKRRKVDVEHISRNNMNADGV